MAATDLASASEREEFDADYFEEYVRESLFNPYMGTSENSIIQLKEQLTRKAGDTIRVPLIGRLTNAGVTGDSSLKGNEEALGNWSHSIEVDQLRNGVLLQHFEETKTEMNLRKASRSVLKMWSMDKLRTAIINAMQSPVVDGVTTYAAATEAQKDTWVTNNSDRALFGNATSNLSAADHSASLANIDATNDILDGEIMSLAKRMAKLADPHIRPWKIDDSEMFVLFCNSYSFRDLQTSTTMQAAQREAWSAGRTSVPQISGASLQFDGVIAVEVPEITAISGVGASSINVAPNFLCGAQAVGLAWSERPSFKVDIDDYENKHGVAVAEIRGVEKFNYGSTVKQHGMVTVYTAGVSD